MSGEYDANNLLNRSDTISRSNRIDLHHSPHLAQVNLPSRVLAAEYQTVLPNEKLLGEELAKTRRELEARSLARTSDAPAG